MSPFQLFLVSIGLLIFCIRATGHHSSLTIYPLLEAVVYSLLLKLLWPTVHISKVVKVPIHRIDINATEATRELVLSPIRSPEGERSEPEDSIIAEIIRLADGNVATAPPSVPLLRPVLTGFPTAPRVPITCKKVVALRPPAPSQGVKLSAPRAEGNYDPGKFSVREMETFEAKAMKELTAITSRVTEKVRALKSEDSPPVLQHSPSILDIPKPVVTDVVKESDASVVEVNSQTADMMIEAVQPAEPVSPMFALSQPRAPSQVTPFSPVSPVPSAMEVTVPDTGRATFRAAENPFARKVETRRESETMDLEPARTQGVATDSYSARLETDRREAETRRTTAFAPVPSTFSPMPSASAFASVPSTSTFSPVPSASAFTPVPSASSFAPVPSASAFVPQTGSIHSSAALPPHTADAVRPLLDHIASKAALIPRLEADARREIVRFCYCLGSKSIENSKLRGFVNKIATAVKNNNAPLYFLADRILSQNVTLFRENQGIVYADLVAQAISLLSHDLKPLEDIFISELQVREPCLCPTPLARSSLPTSSEDNEEGLESAYFNALVFGFLALKKGKLTLAHVWTVLSAFGNEKLDADSKHVPPVVAALLRVTGAEMSVAYGRQFTKLVNLLLNAYLTEFSQLFPQDSTYIYIRELAHLTRSGNFKPPLPSS